MPRELLEDGVVLEFDERVFTVERGASPAAVPPGNGPRRAPRAGGSRYDDSPQAGRRPPGGASGAAPPTGAAERLAARLVARGVVDRAGAPIPLGAAARAAGTQRREAPVAGRLTVPLAAGENAVVLLEGDGVLAWRYGREAPASALAALPATARRGRAVATRALVFEIDVPAIAGADATASTEEGAPAARRGWIRDKLIDGAKAIVLYFAAGAVAAGAVYLAERKRRTGPVAIGSATDAGAWQPIDDLHALALPTDRPPRLLLLVHGTFSSTVGGFGELTVTPWGQRLLASALARYDAVIGFDHRTLSVSPLDNARDLLAALRTLPPGPPIEIDAISHSRGGLVLRSLTEHLLPGAGLDVSVKRAIFVAATNHGTELARPDNWETLVDLTTNLVSVTANVLSLFPGAAATAQIVDEVIDSIGDFVKYLIDVAVTERQVPGIAAMDPSGEFVRTINETQAGQPTRDQIECFAVVSNFHARLLESGAHEPKELPKRLAFILADGVIDRLMRGTGAVAVANDLVVDVASMTSIDASEIDRAVGGFVKDVLDFGNNPLVYHTNYFVRPETAGRLAQWLRLPSPLDGIDPLQLAGAQRGIAPLRADATVAQARALIVREAPDFIVIARQDPARERGVLLHYAVKPAEFTATTRGAAPERRVIDAFQLHEYDRSEPLDPQSLPFDGSAVTVSGNRPHGRRGVVMAGSEPAAVLDDGFVAADVGVLAAMAAAIERSTALAARPPAATAAGPAGAPPPPTRRPPPPRQGRNPTSGDAVGSTNRGTRAVPHATKPAPAAPRAAPKPAPIHTTAEMPRQTRLGRSAVVSVTLSAEQIEAAAGTASDRGSFVPATQESLTLHVIPRRGFDYDPADLTDGLATVPLPRTGEPQTRDFTFSATEVGPGEVTVAVRQGAVRLLTLTLRAEVIDAAKAPRRGSAAGSAVAAPGPECGVCPTLEIFDRRSAAGEMRFEYILRAGDVSDRFRSEAVKVDLQAYVADRYAEIETAWRGSQRAIDRYTLRLEAMGGQMFRELFPPVLQHTLWRLAEAGDLDGILVNSDEPFLPWEVVRLDDPAAPAATPKGRFFGELGLCRWLYGATPVCRIRVRPGRARFLIPHYPDPTWTLVNAEDVEEPLLMQQYGATVLEPHHDEVVAALKGPGGFDLLHFAGHGEADAEQIDSAALMLAGEMVGVDYAREPLRASTVAQFANLRSADGSRPLVVVNACQAGRIGHSLTGLGGFATAFLGTREGSGDSRGRAGAFVGALWSVGDAPASEFVTALYRELKAGKTIAQASRTARAEARNAGDGSWLAYTVYAHPQLKVDFA